MQENVKAAWRERLYASASAVALGCLSPVSSNAGALDTLSARPIDPALANIPRISAPSKWSAYQLAPKAHAKLAALAVPVPAMAPAPVVQQKDTKAQVTIPKRRMSPLDVAWSSQSPKPSISEHAPVKVAAAKPELVAQKPVQVAHKPVQAANPYKSAQVVHTEMPSEPLAMYKASVKMAAVTSMSSLPPSVAPAAEAAERSEARLKQKITTGPITPSVAPTAFKRNGKSPLEIIASLQREEIKVGVLLQEEAAQQPVAEIAAARKDMPVTPPVKLTEAVVPEKKPEAASVASLQDLWKDFDNVQDAVPALEPAAGGKNVHLAPPPVAKDEPKVETTAEVKKAPEEIKPVTQVSLTEASQTTQIAKNAESNEQRTLSYSSPLEITSGTTPHTDGLWQDFDKTGEPAAVAAAQPVQATVQTKNFEPSTLEPAAGGEPLSLMPPSAPKETTDVKQDLPTAKPLPPIPEEAVAEKKAMTAEEIIATEAASDTVDPVPAPGKKSKAAAKAALSAESLAVLDSLPPEVRSSNVPKKNVTLDRSNKAGSEEDAVKKHEAYGMKISVKRPKVDVFRMLESAYNSLIAGDQQYAITLYKEVLDEEPDNTLALFGLATTYHRAGQTTLARPLYAKLLEIDPHNVEGLNNFLVLLADESPDAALEELEKLRQSHPGFSPVLAQMALIHERRGEYDLAAQKLAQANSISPENLKYQYNMAIVLDKMKDWPEASKWYQRLLTASERGEKIPGNAQEIQQRLTFIRSNTSTVN